MNTYQQYLKNDATNWLLNSNPWTQHRTQLDLLNADPQSDEVLATREALLMHPLIQQLISDAQDWQPRSASRNNDPKISYFKLRMLADFGLHASDPGMENIIQKATAHVVDGMFGVRGVIPERPKKGEKPVPHDPTADVWHASPCNTPIITYALLKLGYQGDDVNQSVDQLIQRWQQPTGWFCHFFFVNSQFKKLQTGCPMAGLMALDVFSQLPDMLDSDATHNAFNTLKYHYDYGKTLYYFGRSKKFWTMKYPFVWYNALYLADVLTRFEFTRSEPMMDQLIQWIIDMQDDDGRYTPTSMFMPYKGWDFANKKEPSPWITFLCYRILKRWTQ